VLPLLSLLALFSVFAFVGVFSVVLGPLGHVKANSQMFSAIKPPR
jgi:hypothetical protein